MNVDCDLWSRATVETAYVTRVCAYVCGLVSGELAADVIAVVRASRGAQSTVDGFYAIHTKLTDSVECSPRQAARRQRGKVTDGKSGARGLRQEGG